MFVKKDKAQPITPTKAVVTAPRFGRGPHLSFAPKAYFGFHYISMWNAGIKYCVINGWEISIVENLANMAVDSGLFDKAWLYVSANSYNGDISYTLRKNGVSTDLTQTILMGQTGLFVLSVNVKVTAGDLVNWMADLTLTNAGNMTLGIVLRFRPM